MTTQLLIELTVIKPERVKVFNDLGLGFLASSTELTPPDVFIWKSK